MSDVLPTGEEQEETFDAAPEPDSLAAELGIELTDEDRALAEKMVTRLKSQLGLEPVAQEEAQPEPSEPEESDDEPEEPEAPEPVEQTPPQADDWITIDGRAVPVAEARSMLELRRYLSENPEKADKVRAVIEDQPQPEKPAEVEPPEWLDLEDPSQKFMWETLKSQHQQIARLQQSLGGIQANTARQDAQRQVDLALSTFRTNHPELTEDDVQTVRVHAVGLNIIPGLEKVMASGSEAVLKALDLAYQDHPEFRAKATGVPSPKEQKQGESKARKQKLAGLAGSSVGATREPSAPKRPETDREMREMATKWLTEQGILGS
jgi:hypothetical protein